MFLLEPAHLGAPPPAIAFGALVGGEHIGISQNLLVLTPWAIA